MMGQRTALPLYDRRRLEALVMEHRMRVHLEQKKAGKAPAKKAGVKAPR
ncbi:MAG: hypothetical protein IJC33_02510 [Clostridia bacterium]|nr:hypothetical protein [Clostridia bacterium]